MEKSQQKQSFKVLNDLMKWAAGSPKRPQVNKILKERIPASERYAKIFALFADELDIEKPKISKWARFLLFCGEHQDVVFAIIILTSLTITGVFHWWIAFCVICAVAFIMGMPNS